MTAATTIATNTALQSLMASRSNEFNDYVRSLLPASIIARIAKTALGSAVIWAVIWAALLWMMTGSVAILFYAIPAGLVFGVVLGVCETLRGMVSSVTGAFGRAVAIARDVTLSNAEFRLLAAENPNAACREVSLLITQTLIVPAMSLVPIVGRFVSKAVGRFLVRRIDLGSAELHMNTADSDGRVTSALTAALLHITDAHDRLEKRFFVVVLVAETLVLSVLCAPLLLLAV